jgi:hypothetical protein
MMNVMNRRDALTFFGATIGADGISGSAVAQQVVQADAKTPTPPVSAANIEPASHVNGDYQAHSLPDRPGTLVSSASGDN